LPPGRRGPLCRHTCQQCPAVPRSGVGGRDS
jgi:hypothetical protein